MKKLKIVANVGFALAIGLFTLTSCESDADNLGSQFLEGNGANGNEVSYDIIANNINNNDTVRSDSKVLATAILGAFNEPVFGAQKASYVTQIRPSAYNPNFGTNPKVDSVVMQLVPSYAADSATTNTYTLNKVAADQDSTKTVVTYPITKYGKAKINGAAAPMTINVSEVTDFLYDTSTMFMSNKQVATGVQLGSKTVPNGTVSSVKIVKIGDNTELVNSAVGIRIPLNSAYFQNKIIAAQGQNVLNDAASFIRYMNGLRISVLENDGYLFYVTPANMSVTMYYSNDNTTNGTTTRQANTFTFDLSTANSRFDQYSFANRSAGYNTAVSNYDTQKGASSLYMQGTGGAGAEVIIPDATIQGLQNLYKNSKIGIISAKIRFYSDDNIWNNAFPKPNTFTVLQKSVASFIADMTTLAGAGYTRVKMTQPVSGSNSVYYDVSITQTLKNIVEQGATNYPIELNVGDFAMSAATQTTAASYLGYNYTTRSYTPNRIVLVGSNTSDASKKAQLKIIYTSKK